jgi:probable F420-dependent oxidoreductase
MTLRLGAVFPQNGFGRDAGAIRAYARGLEELGLEQLVAYDHVLGAGLSTRPDWDGPYSADDPFHEPFVLFSHLAAVTTTLEFAPCVLILPQRQTALVAKQAAELQILSEGRLRLGVGAGWNEVEYEALGVPFARRAARLEEQIGVLRALWSSPTVDVDDTYHRISDAGINPLPETPVPIWLGGGQTPSSLDRVARLADGWTVMHFTAAEAAPAVAEFWRLVAEHGRDKDAVGLEARLYLGELPRAEWRDEAAAWAELGATRFNLVTDQLGLRTPDEHLATLRDALAGLR